MFWRLCLCVGVIGITIANVCATVVAWDVTVFPHMMLSDYVIHPPAAAIVNVWWTTYVALHFLMEARLLYRINYERVDRSAEANRTALLWNWSWFALLWGWGAMCGCLIWDIKTSPDVHSVLGGIYGAGWLVCQGLRYLYVDEHRARVGLADAPRAAVSRGLCCAMEVATGPFIASGMMLPLALCPDWLSWACIFSEHLIWVHARTIFSALSYYPDAQLLDFKVLPPPPPPKLAKVLSGHNLKTFVAAVQTTTSCVQAKLSTKKDGSARKRLSVGFRATTLRGL